jgi:2-phospho-L-lactate guanylyltransferase
MQATVAEFDSESREGTVLLDDGVRLPFTADAVAPTVRHLRLGQRVRLEMRGSGADLVVDRVQIITLRQR